VTAASLTTLSLRLRGAEEGYVDPAIFSIIKDVVEHWQRTYFLLIYIKLEDHLRLCHNRGMDDGVRSTNEEFQLAIEDLIIKSLE